MTRIGKCFGENITAILFFLMKVMCLAKLQCLSTYLNFHKPTEAILFLVDIHAMFVIYIISSLVQTNYPRA